MTKKCIICGDGRGWWVDKFAQQTVYCSACNPREYETHVDWGMEGWVTSRWVQYPAKYWEGPKFQQKPWLLVIHSGGYRAGIAEFFRREGAVVYRGKTTKVNAHINYSITYDDFVQSVPFNTVGKHAGGSVWKDRKGVVHRHLNFCSIGLELPGPVSAPLPPSVIDKFRATIVYLLEFNPSIKVAVRHRDVDRRKRDPGINFDWEWISDLGLYLPFYDRR